MIKRPAACQSDAEPAPKKPKTKPPTPPATMDEPASTSFRIGGRTVSRRGIPLGRPGRAAIHKPKKHATRTCPLGPFQGVPTEATPWIGFKDFRIYTDVRATQWRVKRRGSSEIPPDAHDDYLLCGTTAYRYHRIFLGASGWAFKRKILYWDSYMHCLGQDLTREAEQSFSAWSGGIQAKLSDIVHAWSRFLANCQKHN